MKMHANFIAEFIMKKMSLFALLLVGGCAGGAQSPQTVVVKKITLTPSQTAIVQKAVVADFKDPNSAQFRDVSAALLSDGSIYVCGGVNGKNSYGGYVGFKSFNGRADKEFKSFTPIRVGSEAFEEPLVRSACKANGIELP